jgi:glyoxylase-like metal-dependent hydrolase (beta-lactamase superfamily II)
VVRATVAVLRFSDNGPPFGAAPRLREGRARPHGGGRLVPDDQGAGSRLQRGIGGSLRTTAFLVDEDILIDAGTGVGDLSLEQLAKIDHIFVSHSHLDHVTSIPFLVDTVCWMRRNPIVVHGIKETLDILRAHLFNWKIWPDFTQIPNGDNPFMVYSEIKVGQASS